MESYKTKTTHCGLKTIVVKRPNNLNRIQLNLVYGIGSDLEKGSNLEISHFLEHLFVSLTSKKYPSSKKNREIFSKHDISYTASVGTKTTEFEFSFDKQYMQFFFDILINAMYDFRVDKEIFKNEKNSIIEELNEIIDDLSYPLETNTESVIYRGHNRQQSQKKRLENTKKITPQNIESFYKKFYRLPYCVLGIYGNIEINSLCKIIDKIASSFKQSLIQKPYNSLLIKNLYPSYNLFNESKVIFSSKSDTISTIKILWRIDMNTFSKSYFNLYCLDYVLLDDLSSLLLKKLRGELGLIYDIKSQFSLDEHQNSLSFYIFETTVASSKVLKVISAFMDVINSITENPISSSDYSKYIQHQKTIIDDRKESLDYKYYLNNYAKYLLYDEKFKTLKDEDKLYLGVTPQSILDTARKILNTNNLYISYSNNKNISKKIDKLLTSLSF